MLKIPVDGVLKRLRGLRARVGNKWLFGVFLALVAGLLFFPRHYDVLDTGFYMNQIPSPIMTPAVTVVQEFSVNGPLSRMDIRFGTYDNTPRGTLRLRIRKSTSVVFDKEIPGNRIRNNWMTSFSISPRLSAGNYRLILQFRPVDEKDKLSVWMTHNDRYSRGRLFINRSLQSGDLAFRVYYRSRLLAGLRTFLQRFHVLPHYAIVLLIALWLCFGVLVLYGVFKRW